MEVKTKTSSLRVTEPADSAPRLQRPIDKIAIPAVNKTAPGESELRLALSPRSDERTGELSAANDVIGVINLASQITEEIDGIVRLVAGVAAQVSVDDLSDNRRATLQNEAREALAALSERTFTAPTPTVGGTLNQTVREELERTLGRTLEFLVPEQLTTELTLGGVNFSTKEAILRTQTAVEVTRKRIELIKSGLADSRSLVQRFLESEEVAAENIRAASSSVRALDDALGLVGTMRLNITSAPVEALGSIGELGERAMSTLR